jgi:hypothetical protein
MSDGGAQQKEYGPYLDRNGDLYPNIKVYHYAAGTSNAKTVWTDEAKTTADANPSVGNASGVCSFYGDGDYKIVIKDENDNPLDDPISYDNVKITSDTATMWEGNKGTVLPSAAAANKGQLFLLVDGSDNFLSLHVNADGSTWETVLEKDSSGAYTIFDNIIAGGPWVDIRAHLPDGFVTDGSVDYVTEIQAAVDSIKGSAGVGGDAQVGVGGVVYFPPGKWQISATLNVDNDNRRQNITLLGAGPITSVLYNSNTGGAGAIAVDGDAGDLNYGFKISNMSIWGNSSSGVGVSLDSCVKQIELDRVDIYDHGGTGVSLVNSSANLKVTNCRIRNSDAAGISVASSSSNVTIDTSEFRANATYGVSIGESGRQVNIHNCYFEGNVLAIVTNGADSDAGVVSSCNFTNNHFYNNGQDISLTNAGSSRYSENINIIGNLFDATIGTDAVDGGGSALAGTVACITLARARHCAIDNNEFRNVVSGDVDTCINIAGSSAATNNYIGRQWFAVSTTITKLTNSSVITDNNYGYTDTNNHTSYVFNRGTLIVNQGFQIGDNSIVQISGGVLSITKSNHRVTAETAPGGDALETINIDGSAPTSEHDGWELFLSTSDAADQITVSDNTGNIQLAASTNFLMDDRVDILHLLYKHTSSRWVEVSRSANT